MTEFQAMLQLQESTRRIQRMSEQAGNISRTCQEMQTTLAINFAILTAQIISMRVR